MLLLKAQLCVASFLTLFVATHGSKRLFAIGGVNNGALSSVDVYDIDAETWSLGAGLPLTAYEFGAVVLSTKIYAIGGAIDGSGAQKSTLTYDLMASEWSAETALMNTPRNKHGVAVLGNKIFAVGGYDDRSYLKSVEAFDPNNRKWTLVNDMNVARGFLAVAVLDDKLYAIGGSDGLRSLNSVEAYNGYWSKVEPLLTARSGHAVASVSGKIYVAGGYNTYEGYLKSVEFYDVGSSKWSYVAEMLSARTAFGAVSSGDLVYVVGGYSSGTGFHDTVDVYGTNTNSWTRLGARMPLARAEHAVALVEQDSKTL